MKEMAVNHGKAMRFPELDSLRGIAVIVVLLYHYTYAYDFHFNLFSDSKFYLHYGDLAVQLFFIISGFVILLTLERSKNRMDFLVNRFSRLYPAYWVAIIITVLFTVVMPIPTLGNYSLKEVLVNLTMLQGFVKIRHIDQVYWTLKYELIFYVLMYLLYVLGLLKNIRIICTLWLVVCVASLLTTFPLKKYIDVLLLVDQAAYFIAGICFYKIKMQKASVFDYLLIAATYLVGSCWLYKMHDGDWGYIIILFLIYSLFFLFALKNVPLLNSKILLFLGAISYPLYLLHNVIGYAIINQLRKITDIQFIYVAVPFIITFIIAFLVERYIEKPSLNFIRIRYRNWMAK